MPRQRRKATTANAKHIKRSTKQLSYTSKLHGRGRHPPRAASYERSVPPRSRATSDSHRRAHSQRRHRIFISGVTT